MSVLTYISITNIFTRLDRISQDKFDQSIKNNIPNSIDECNIFKIEGDWFVSNDLEVNNGYEVTFNVSEKDFTRVVIYLPPGINFETNTIMLTPNERSRTIRMNNYISGLEYHYSVIATDSEGTEYAYGPGCPPKIRIN